MQTVDFQIFDPEKHTHKLEIYLVREDLQIFCDDTICSFSQCNMLFIKSSSSFSAVTRVIWTLFALRKSL